MADRSKQEILYVRTLKMTDKEKYDAFLKGEFDDVKVYFVSSSDPRPGLFFDSNGFLVDASTGKRTSPFVASALKARLGSVVIDMRFVKSASSLATHMEEIFNDAINSGAEMEADDDTA